MVPLPNLENREWTSSRGVTMMIRICVAIILVAVIKSNAKPPLNGYQSSILSRSNHPHHLHTNSPRERTHVLQDPSNPVHEVPRSRNLVSRPELTASEPLTPKSDNLLDSKKSSEEDLHGSENYNQGYIDIEPNLKLSGYPNSKALKSHYQVPIEISTKSGFLKATDGSQSYEDLNHNQYERMITEYGGIKPHIITEYALAKPTDLPKSMITEYENPKLTYGMPNIERMKNYRSPTYGTPKSLATAGNVNKNYAAAKAIPQKYLSDSYGSPSIQTTYAYEPQRDIHSEIGRSKSSDHLKSLESMYDSMHSVDLTYGIPRNIKNIPTSSKGIRPNYGIPRNNINTKSDNYRSNEYEKYDKINHQRGSVYSENNKELDSIYSSPNSNSNYAEDFDTSLKHLGDSFKEHVLIASKHTAKPKQHMFDQSKHNNVEDSVQDYHSQNFVPRNVNDYDQTYNLRNLQVFDTFESGEIKGYGAARDLSMNYESPGSDSSLLKMGYSDVVAKNSPGVTGVTQAIIRNHSPAVLPKPRNQLGHVSRHILPQVHEINEGLRSELPPAHLHQNQNNNGISTQKTRARGGKHFFKSGRSQNEEGGFEGYTFGRNADAENVPAAYRFEYAVSDDGSESRFGHRESRQHERAKGSYHVLLPDGRKQIVEYEADERGFKPTITYEEPEPSNGYDLRSGVKDGYNGNKQDYNINNKFEERRLTLNYDKTARSNQYSDTDGDRIEASANDDVSNNRELETHVGDYEFDYDIDTSTNRENTGEFGNKYNVKTRFLNADNNGASY